MELISSSWQMCKFYYSQPPGCVLLFVFGLGPHSAVHRVDDNFVLRDYSRQGSIFLSTRDQIWLHSMLSKLLTCCTVSLAPPAVCSCVNSFTLLSLSFFLSDVRTAVLTCWDRWWEVTRRHEWETFKHSNCLYVLHPVVSHSRKQLLEKN